MFVQRKRKKNTFLLFNLNPHEPQGLQKKVKSAKKCREHDDRQMT